MSERVVMPTADWQAILDSVRAKMQTSDPIKSGELAGIIDALQAVGDQFVAIASGTVTMASTVTTEGGMEIEHGLGVAPNLFVFFADELKTNGSPGDADINWEAAVYMAEGAQGTCGVFVVGSGYSAITTMTTWSLIPNISSSQDLTVFRIEYFITEEKVKLFAGIGNVLRAGRKFHWLCGATKNR